MSDATLAFIGDVMLGRLVDEAIPKRTPESLWGDCLDVLTSADAVFANLECAITTASLRWRRTPKVFHFGARPAAVDILKAANIRYVSLANNHVLDFEEEGLLDTLTLLDKGGIARAGAGRTLDAAMAPVLVDVAETSVGVISMTDNESPFAAAADRPGTYYTPISTDAEVLKPLEHRIRSLRRAGAKLVVLSAHWGPNMVQRPPPRFREFATAMIDHGVDLLHGHSAHIFQGVERYRRGLVLFDTGDFIDDYAVEPDLRNDWSFIFLIDMRDGEMHRLRMRPVVLDFAEVNLAKGHDFDLICDRMVTLSTEMGAKLRRTGEGLVLDLETSI